MKTTTSPGKAGGNFFTSGAKFFTHTWVFKQGKYFIGNTAGRITGHKAVFALYNGFGNKAVYIHNWQAGVSGFVYYQPLGIHYRWKHKHVGCRIGST